MEERVRVLEARIGRLEREARAFRIQAVVGLALAFVALAAVAWPRSRSITADRLTVVDGDGRAAVELAVGPDGPGLVLHGPSGGVLNLTAGPQATGLHIQDPAGPDVSLLAGNQPYLFFGDAAGTETLLIGIHPSDGPRLQLKASKRVWLARARPDADGANLVIQDRSGRVVWHAP